MTRTDKVQEHKGGPKRKSEATSLRAELARLQAHNDLLTRQLASARVSEKAALQFVEIKELYAKLWAREEDRARKLEKRVNELEGNWKPPKFEVINFKPQREGGAA